MMTNDERKSMLSDILSSYSEDLDALKYVLRMDNNPSTSVEDYVIALHDGLRYGNWPWVNRSAKNVMIRDFRGIE